MGKNKRIPYDPNLDPDLDFSKYDKSPKDVTDEDESGEGGQGSIGGTSGGGDTERTPFTTSSIRATQRELMEHERQFGRVDTLNRKDPAEPEQNMGQRQTETLASHPLLANSQMWAGMAENDSLIANADTLVEFFENHPELVNDPKLRMALENAKRNEYTTTPKMAPPGT